MLLGPIQFIAIGLDNDKQRGQIARELRAVTEKGDIRILDLLAIRKEDDGTIVWLGESDLTEDQRVTYGAVLGGLMGFGIAGDEGVEPGAVIGAENFATQNFGLTQEDIQEIADDLPSGKTILLALYEHRWAVDLKQAIASAGGEVLAQAMVRPESVVMYGALMAEADDLTQEDQP